MTKRLFSDETVRQIREQYAAGKTLETIANWYWVNTTTIWKIVQRITYRDVK